MSSEVHQPEENRMGYMPVNTLLLTMSGPMMVSMLIQALYNVVDSMFVSAISEAALTAVSLAFPVQNMIIAVATGTGVGVNALLSRNLGERNFKVVNRTAGNALFLSIVSCLVCMLLCVCFCGRYFTMQVSDPEVITLGMDYLYPVMLLSFGCFGQIMLSRLLQSTGKTFYSMLIQSVGAILNIILDPILIFGWFGAPAMGVSGAAIATVISQIVGMVMGIYYNLRKNREIQFSLSQFRPSAGIITRIYSVGIPSILLQTVISVLTFGLNQILVKFSEVAVAVYGVYFKLQGFAFLPIIGMNNGMVPIIAYNYGAKKPDRILQTVKLAITYALCIMVVAFLIFQLCPDKLLSVFNAGDEMLQIGVPALRITSTCFLVGGFTIVCSSMFQALGKGFLSMSISVFRQLILVLPLAFLFSLTGNVNLVWVAFPVAEILAGMLAAVFLRRAIRSVRKIGQGEFSNNPAF